MRLVYFRTGLGFLAGLLTLAAPAAAQEGPPRADATDPATAQTLFEQAKRAMHEGRYAEACPKLAESERLDPAGGTVFALGLCYEAAGQTASAWAAFNDAVSFARKDGRSDRQASALDHVQKLEPLLTRVRVIVTSAVPGLEVRRDGARIGEAVWATAVPVDPGPHTFEATAPGKRPWTSTQVVEGAGRTVDVPVPALEDVPPPAVSSEPPPQVAVPPSPPETPAPAAVERSSGSRWIPAAIGLGVGVAGAAVGTGFALAASSKWSTAHADCVGGQCASPADVQLGKTAGRDADVATAAFVVGGVGLAASAVLFAVALTSGPPRREAALAITPAVGPSSVGVSVGGAL